MRLDVRSDGVDVVELLLAERTDEVLRGVYGGVVDEVVLRRERVVALLAAELLLGLGAARALRRVLRAQVSSIMVRFYKALVAEFARIRPLTGMGPHVPRQFSY